MGLKHIHFCGDVKPHLGAMPLMSQLAAQLYTLSICSDIIYFEKSGKKTTHSGLTCYKVNIVNFVRVIHTELSHTVRKRDRNRYREKIQSTVRCGNVHTGLRQGRGPEHIFSCCADPVPVPVQCD